MRISLIFTTLVCISSIAFAADGGTPLTVKSADKTSSITLQLADGWKTYDNKDGSTSILTPRTGVNIQVWALSQTSLDKAANNAAELVKTQVTHFKPKQTNPIKIAGSMGKKISGPGVEADDGDPSTAEVYLFSVEGKLYMICAHAEGDVATKGKKVVPALLDSIHKAGS